MSRVINTDGPGKERSQLMRTAAELIRRLGQKNEIDAETHDIAALLVFCLREIDAGIDESVRAWEKRDYWVKAEQFRLRWAWARKAAYDLDRIIYTQNWGHLPPTLIALLPYFEDIKISRFTRSPSLWQGAYHRLAQEHARSESKSN
jgi:hypothetical protein